ncbi:hypothetical protein ABEW19_29070 [Paenibacillus illinoisensis]|uniref:hypothetical protein n=1 Tax=Paenibacillus illinoisensis TaxID=59845 RepID=UPI003D2BE7A7
MFCAWARGHIYIYIVRQWIASLDDVYPIYNQPFSSAILTASIRFFCPELVKGFGQIITHGAVREMERGGDMIGIHPVAARLSTSFSRSVKGLLTGLVRVS